jgi:hypothetical protein
MLGQPYVECQGVTGAAPAGRSGIRRLDRGRGDRNGGRAWWAHFVFTRINIEPTFLRKKIEDLRQMGAFMVRTGGVGNPTANASSTL